MKTVSTTATIMQTSHTGKKEPTILKDGARVQLVIDSIPSANPIKLNGLFKLLIDAESPFTNLDVSV